MTNDAGVVTAILGHIYGWHKKRVEKKYPERKPRAWQPVHWVIERARQGERLKEVFGDKYFDEVQRNLEKTGSEALHAFGSYCILTAFVYYVLTGNDIKISAFGFSLQANDASVIVAAVAASFLLFRLSDKASKVLSYLWILDAYSEQIIPKFNKTIDLNEMERGLYLARYGSDIFDFLAMRNTIKVKYIADPKKLYLVTNNIAELFVLALAVAMLFFWSVNTYIFLFESEMSLYLRLVAVVPAWLSAIYFFTKVATGMSILMAILAKGRRDDAPLPLDSVESMVD